MKTNTAASKAERIISALLEHGSHEKAAAALGISTSTIWRWLQKPAFQKQYRQARAAAFLRGMGRLQHAADLAVTTVLSILVDKDQPAASRVRAADSVLDYATRTFVEEDLEPRIEALEQTKKTPAVNPELPGPGKRTVRKMTSGLSGQQERLILALLEHGNHERAAAALGISTATVRRWVEKPQFQKRYGKARREAFSTCMRRLQNAVNPAIVILSRIMVDLNTPAAIRLRAADVVLDHAYANLALEELEARLRALES